MTQAAFEQHMTNIAADIAGKPVDDALQTYLNKNFGPGSGTFEDIEKLCHQGVEEGWLCDREAGGIGFGRILKPEEKTHNFSVDVVRMNNVKGPHHVHTTGEIGMIMPMQGTALFDGKERGWYVYPPGSAHYPTVSNGEALVLYLLPGGEIEFTGR